jgi:cytochrome P450
MTREEQFPLGALLTVDELAGDPYPLFERLRREEPVTWAPALDSWVVTSRRTGLAVARDSEMFTVDDPRMSVKAVLGENMLTTDGAVQQRHRTPFAQPFRLAPVREQLGGFVDRTIALLLDAVADEARTELRSTVAAPLAVRTVTQALGLPLADVSHVLEWYEAFADGMTHAATGSQPPERSRLAFAHFAAAVEQALSGIDAGGSLLAAAARPRASSLARADVIANAALIMFGGIETTESLILNAVWLLLTHPGQLELLRARPELLESAVDEAARVEAAVVSFERFATRSTVLHDVPIGPGDAVTVMAGAMNRDAAFFPDPDVFDITRANARHHAAFGAGPHVCLGMHLARLEAQMVVRALLGRFPALMLDRQSTTPPAGASFRKPHRLTVRLG